VKSCDNSKKSERCFGQESEIAAIGKGALVAISRKTREIPLVSDIAKVSDASNRRRNEEAIAVAPSRFQLHHLAISLHPCYGE